MARSYIATLRVKEGFLLGGVKRIDSVHFQTVQQARDWIFAAAGGQQNKTAFGTITGSAKKPDIMAKETGHKGPRKNPASFHNIEKSAFKRAEYVGYGNGVWRIFGGSGDWTATRADGPSQRIHAPTLKEISEKISTIAKRETAE